jgi:hypothetical protein
MLGSVDGQKIKTAARMAVVQASIMKQISLPFPMIVCTENPIQLALAGF